MFVQLRECSYNIAECDFVGVNYLFTEKNIVSVVVVVIIIYL